VTIEIARARARGFDGRIGARNSSVRTNAPRGRLVSTSSNLVPATEGNKLTLNSRTGRRGVDVSQVAAIGNTSVLQVTEMDTRSSLIHGEEIEDA